MIREFSISIAQTNTRQIAELVAGILPTEQRYEFIPGWSRGSLDPQGKEHNSTVVYTLVPWVGNRHLEFSVGNFIGSNSYEVKFYDAQNKPVDDILGQLKEAFVDTPTS